MEILSPGEIDFAVVEDAPLLQPATLLKFAPSPYIFPDPARIPRRQWLFGRHYIRGAVSATIGAPGRGKSTNALVETMSMAIGRDLLTGATLPSGPLRAAYLNGEETADELDRRVAAIGQRFRVTAEDCGDRLFVESTRDRQIKVVLPGPRGGAIANTGVVGALKSWCEERRIDVLTVDPLISFHSVNESDNGAMDVVCKDAFGIIAGNSRAIELVHHPRKLQLGESNTTVDDARGASAILGAVREARTINFMSSAEAAQLGIRDDERRRHIRIDNGKSNMAPIGAARWLKLETENLPNGDTVACVTSWNPPNPFDDLTVADLRVVQQVVQGGAFRTDSQSAQWLGWWMAANLTALNISTRFGDETKDKGAIARLNKILKTWVNNGMLKKVDGRDENRKRREFYAVGELVEASSSLPQTEPSDDE